MTTPDAVMVNTTLGTNVLLAREHKGLTQCEVAERSGITQAWVTQIERDHSHPSIAVLLRLAKALDTTATKLLEGVES